MENNYISKYNNKRIWDIINRSIPQQKARINTRSSEILDRIWRTSKWYSNVSMFKTPSDLFFANTIPVQDLLYTYYTTNGDELNYRVVIFERYRAIISYAIRLNRDRVTVGVFVFTAGDKEWCVPINVTIGKDEIDTDNIRIGYKDASLKDHDELKDLDIKKIFEDGMRIWYGIMMYMLHPTVNTVIKEKVKHIEGNSKTKKVRLLTTEEIKTINESKFGKIIDDYDEEEGFTLEAVRSDPYQATNVINSNFTFKYWTEEEINAAINKSLTFGTRSMHRRTAIWPCIGYWRQNFDRKGNFTRLSFVRPHWRGPMAKNMKNAHAKIKDITVDTNLGDYSRDYKIDPKNWNLGKTENEKVMKMEDVI